LEFILNQHRNKLIWDEIEPNIFKRKKIRKLTELKENKKFRENIEFIENASINLNSDTKYITVGKGYPV